MVKVEVPYFVTDTFPVGETGKLIIFRMFPWNNVIIYVINVLFVISKTVFF